MASSQGGSSRKSLTLHGKKKGSDNELTSSPRKSFTASRPMGLTGDRTVKRLRLSRALTVPESTSIYDACRRMASRGVDALLLTDSNALLCGILTDKDIATRAVACELDLKETPVSKVMTRSPKFVLSDSLAVDALQKMVQGKFRHLPVVENGEVKSLLDIAKCLYDAIARMERAAEKGKAIAAAVEGVERQWGTSISGPNSFLETLREQMFKPSLATIIPENTNRILAVSPTDSVLTATKKMLEMRVSAAVVTVENKPLGILTPRDILMRVIAESHDPNSTIIEKVMTPNPKCGTIDTPIVDALHIMHDGRFLHLPVVDRDGNVVAVLDVLHITHAAVATVGNAAGNYESTNTMMQKFWDSAMELNPNDDDDDTKSDSSLKLPSEGETGKSFAYSASTFPYAFAFKIQDQKGRMHRFTCDTRSLSDLIAAILQRAGEDIDRNNLPQIMYEDEDHDKVILASDEDLAAAVEHARSVGWRGLKLHLDYAGKKGPGKGSGSGSLSYAGEDAWASAYRSVAAGAALVAGMGVLAYLKKAGS